MVSYDRSGSWLTILCGMVLLCALAAPDTSLGESAGDPGARVSGEEFRRAAHVLGRDGSPALISERLAGKAAPERLEAVVLMCDFSDSLMFGRHDQVNTVMPEAMQTEFYYDAHDSTYFAHLFGDVQDFYDDASGGRFTFETTVRAETANLQEGMAFYGNHPEFGEQKFQLAADVIAAFDDDVDFSLYDTVVIVHAGAGEETDVLGDSPEQIYSGYLSPEDFEAAVEEEILPEAWIPATDADGGEVRLTQFLILPETEYQDPSSGAGGAFGSLGVYCFEVGLRLGMLSLSDFTPSGYPDSQGIGQFGLMGYGLFAAGGLIPTEPCAFNKMLMGWIDPLEIDPDSDETVTLWPQGTVGEPTLARVMIGPSEYWLVEYRLQDPSGDMVFSWDGDLNGDGVPNFTLQSDPTYRPPLYGDPFDPEIHVHETLDGAEWDFFMSDNNARPAGIKGAGSGLYVWHVDEGVIHNALQSQRNIYNADPDRKAIDVEEADGLQDLDRRVPTFWWLGGDHDSFRGEGTSRFGPDTEPSTATAGGAWTGVVLEEISNVVVDSTATAPGGVGTVIEYAPTMSFRCLREAAPAASPSVVAELNLSGVDLGGSHLLAVDLDVPADGSLEIVAAGAEGQVFVWNHDLSSWRTSIDVPGLLTVGTDAEGEPVTWTGPPVVQDLDGDGFGEIILNGSGDLYIFTAEGAEYLDGDGDSDSHGLAYAHPDPAQNMLHVPRLIPGSAALLGAQSDWLVLMLHQSSEPDPPAFSVTAFDAVAAAAVVVVEEPSLIPGYVAAGPPTFWEGRIVFAGEATDGCFLWNAGTLLALPAPPSSWVPLAIDDQLLLPTMDGGLVWTDGTDMDIWDDTRLVRTPPAPGVAFASDDGFYLTGRKGSPATSWPAWPEMPVRSAEQARAPSAVSWRLDDETTTVFTSRDGRLFAFDSAAEPLGAAWPLAGPGETAGSPVVADLDGIPGLELAAVGEMARLVGLAEDGEEPELESWSQLKVWHLPGTEDADVLWPMWGGDPQRSFTAPAPDVASTGDGLTVEGSLALYPTPTTGDRLVVRAILNVDGALTATLYNLEGEVVADGELVAGLAGEPCEVVLSVGGAVSGPYLCRIEVSGGGRREVQILPAAIER